MRPNVVVDIGNTRVKWGRCISGRLLTHGSFPVDDTPDAWNEVAAATPVEAPIRWAVASVNPPVLTRISDWITSRGDKLLVIDNYQQLPIEVAVEEPTKVGIDRLLGAVAARSRLPAGIPGIVIDVGTAMTVDLIDAEGVFQGGAILPGFGLMFRALHRYTAKLPLVEETDLFGQYPEIDPSPPGKNTANAIAAGVTAAVCGAAEVLVREMMSGQPASPVVFVTGGAGQYLRVVHLPHATRVEFDETLILDGIRLAAEALP